MSDNKSELTLNQSVKKKRGPKKGEDIVGIYLHREIIEMCLLEMFYNGYLGVDPQAGLATLERFIADHAILVSKSGNPLAFNTIKGEFAEVIKDFLKQNEDKKKK